jgi:hypothetical protein
MAAQRGGPPRLAGPARLPAGEERGVGRRDEGGSVRARRPLAILAVLATAEGSSAQVPDQLSNWSLELGAQEHYQTSGQQAVQAGEDFVTYLDTRLGRRFQSRRGGLDLGLDGGAVVDHKVGDLRHFVWGVAASGSYKVSRQGEVRGTVASSFGFSHDVSRLDQSGIVPPYTLTRTDMASAELQHRLPGALTGRLQASGERFVFDSPNLVNGSSVGVVGDVGRELGPRLLTGVSAEYRRSSNSGNKVEIGTVAGRVGVRLTREFTVTLHGGVSRYSLLDTGQPAQSSPTGGVNATGRLGRHTLSAGLAQRVEQTYGLGTIGVVRALFAAYAYAITQRLDVSVRAYDTHVSQVVVGAGPDRGRRYTAGVHYDILRNLVGEVTYTHWDRGSGTDQWQSDAVAVSLRTRFAWR